jgi:hypothetical protein
MSKETSKDGRDKESKQTNKVHLCVCICVKFMSLSPAVIKTMRETGFLGHRCQSILVESQDICNVL